MIGEQLSKLRIEHNMTQEEFAEYMDVSRQAVSKWELNKTLPDVNKLLKISDLFQVSIDYLLKGTGEKSISDKSDENPPIYSCDEKTEIEAEDINIAITEDEDIAEEADLKQTIKQGDKKSGLKISLLLVIILLAGFIAILVKCMLCQAWVKADSEKTLVKVDKIYKQYSLAEVSAYNADGLSTSKTVLLDTNGVREGDYIHCYINNDTGNISIDYDNSTLIIMISISIILLIILVLLIRELKKHEKE